MTDWNSGIIEEFRNNGGEVGGMFDGATLLLLHHTGAKSGTERISPLMYQKLDHGYAIFASKGGGPHDPHWFLNLMANPDTTIELGTERVAVSARRAGTEERDSIWQRQKMDRPQFAEYEQNTDRQIPVVILEPQTA